MEKKRIHGHFLYFFLPFFCVHTSEEFIVHESCRHVGTHTHTHTSSVSRVYHLLKNPFYYTRSLLCRHTQAHTEKTLTDLCTYRLCLPTTTMLTQAFLVALDSEGQTGCHLVQSWAHLGQGPRISWPYVTWWKGFSRSSYCDQPQTADTLLEMDMSQDDLKMLVFRHSFYRVICSFICNQ